MITKNVALILILMVASLGLIACNNGASEIDPSVIASLDADYYIDYKDGTIPIGELPIGTRVVDPSWEWGYSTEDLDILEDSNINKPVNWIIVANDHYSNLGSHVTLLSEELIGVAFLSDKVWNWNHWGESKMRSDLSFGPFNSSFSESFRRATLITTLPNIESKGGTYTTKDQIFIPSTTELGDAEHIDTYQIGSVYPYFQGESDAKRAATFGWVVEGSVEGSKEHYWTRSPDKDYMNVVFCVNYEGRFYKVMSRDLLEAATTYSGVRPAVNLKAETLVTKIGD